MYLPQGRLEVRIQADTSVWGTMGGCGQNLKSHLQKVLGEAKLTFEEFSILLIQVEACLNSHPLTPIPKALDMAEVLTPGHFLIGRPITALPDESEHQLVEPLRWWQLCQSLVRHLWARQC